MWKLICEIQFPHLLTILVTWSKINDKQNKKTHTSDRFLVSVCKRQFLRWHISCIGQAYVIHFYRYFITNQAYLHYFIWKIKIPWINYRLWWKNCCEYNIDLNHKYSLMSFFSIILMLSSYKVIRNIFLIT